MFCGEKSTYKEIHGKNDKPYTVNSLHKYVIGEDLSEDVVRKYPYTLKYKEKRSRLKKFVISHFRHIHQSPHSYADKTAYNCKKHKNSYPFK